MKSFIVMIALVAFSALAFADDAATTTPPATGDAAAVTAPAAGDTAAPAKKSTKMAKAKKAKKMKKAPKTADAPAQ